MKTSNKLILIFALMAVLLPIISTNILFNKVKSKTYTIMPNSSNYLPLKYNEKIPEFKYLKIIGDADSVKINIIKDDTLCMYSYGYLDSDKKFELTQKKIGDTLFVNCNFKNSGNNLLNNFDIGVNIITPKLHNLALINSYVNIFPAANYSSFDSLNIVANKSSFMSIENKPSKIIDGSQTTKFNFLNLTCNNASSIQLNDNLKINHLKIDVKKQSTISIEKNVVVENISGNVEENSSLNASLYLIKKFLK